jgi:hypothetical protein
MPRTESPTPYPATGLYMIATCRLNRLLRFVRNPFFHESSRVAQPDGYPDARNVTQPSDQFLPPNFPSYRPHLPVHGRLDDERHVDCP